MAARMRRVPITAAKRIAEDYGYDQVIVYARHSSGQECVTTYGKTKALCAAAAKIGDVLKDLMGWNGDKAERVAAVVEYVELKDGVPTATRLGITALPSWAREMYGG